MSEPAELVRMVNIHKWFGKVYALKGVDFTVNKPGVYRVQVFQDRIMLPFFRRRSFPWILSNPIYISVKADPPVIALLNK